MAAKNKPAFLKTFSEFTIEELRVMPLHRLFPLFFQEIGSTFTDRKLPKRQKKTIRSKKNTEKHILIARVKPLPSFSFKPLSLSQIKSSEFTLVMKRVFTIGPVKKKQDNKKEILSDEKNKKETVVFSNIH